MDQVCITIEQEDEGACGQPARPNDLDLSGESGDEVDNPDDFVHGDFSEVTRRQAESPHR